MIVDEGDDVGANVRELGLDLVPILLDPLQGLIVPFQFFLLLERR